MSAQQQGMRRGDHRWAQRMDSGCAGTAGTAEPDQRWARSRSARAGDRGGCSGGGRCGPARGAVRGARGLAEAVRGAGVQFGTGRSGCGRLVESRPGQGREQQSEQREERPVDAQAADSHGTAHAMTVACCASAGPVVLTRAYRRQRRHGAAGRPRSPRARPVRWRPVVRGQPGRRRRGRRAARSRPW